MGALDSRVAIVAGASRGAGKGIALALGEAGATVYVIGRTSIDGVKPADGAPGSIEETAEAVTRRGGRGIPIRADCTSPREVAALFERLERDDVAIDVLVNAVWGAADANQSMDEWMAAWGRPFWEQSTDGWTHMMAGGPYAYYLMSAHAARAMAKRKKRGLIVGVTDGHVETGGGDAADAMGMGPLLWNLSHQCINLLMRGMAADGKKSKIAVVTLMPGFMRTERVVRLLATDTLKKQFGFAKSESTEYIGRAVAALASDHDVAKKSGRIHFVADLAAEYGFTDVDGRQIARFAP